MTKGEQTKQKIVAAAAPIFNQHGYKGCSINELMEATGLKKGGIYRHFASKEELAAEAFDYAWEAAWTARMVGVNEKDNHLDQLKQLIANFVNHRSPVAGGCPIMNTAVDSDDGNPALRTRANEALRSWLNRLQTIVKRAKKSGEAKADVDPEAVSTLIVASLEGALMMSRLERSDEPLRQVWAHLDRYLEAEVAAKNAGVPEEK